MNPIIEKIVEEMVRDFTAVAPRSKSEVRRRIESYGKQEYEAGKAWMYESLREKMEVMKKEAYEKGKADGYTNALSVRNPNIKESLDREYERGKADAEFDLEKLAKMTIENEAYEKGKKDGIKIGSGGRIENVTFAASKEYEERIRAQSRKEAIEECFGAIEKIKLVFSGNPGNNGGIPDKKIKR